jgi:type IV pilus assembly protein PilW
MVELMVAVTLGLLATGAVISVFVGARSAYQSTAGTAAIADSGRFALDLIQESARGAGFLGCGHTNTLSQGSENLLNSVANPLSYDFAHALGGYEAIGSNPGGAVTLPTTPTSNAAAASWTPSLDATFGAVTTQQVLGSDVLVLRSSAPRVAPAYTSNAFGAGSMSFQALNTTGLHGNQLVVLSNCVNWWTFQIGTVAGATPATITLGGANSGPLPVGLTAGAIVTPVTTAVYYIGVGADGDSALRRLELVNGAPTFTDEELVPDVENMQVLYGVDTTGTQTASEYVTADNVANFDTVVSVKVAVLSASPPGSTQKPGAAPRYDLLGTQVTAPVDTRSRKVFAVTIGIRDALN